MVPRRAPPPPMVNRADRDVTGDRSTSEGSDMVEDFFESDEALEKAKSDGREAVEMVRRRRLSSELDMVLLAGRSFWGWCWCESLVVVAMKGKRRMRRATGSFMDRGGAKTSAGCGQLPDR